VIIDNITWLSRETDKGKSALPLMQRLCDLKKQHGLSVLVLAHTPKRDETQPITLNDLAGSRILANFADSVFALGKSATDSGLRYLKQLKVRSAEMLYDAGNVAVFQFEKAHNFLGFTFIGESSEREHLQTLTHDARAELIAKARALRAEGKTQREIAKELKISVGAVNKYVRGVHTVNTVNKVNSVNTNELYIPPDATDEDIEALCQGAECNNAKVEGAHHQ
jgi:hypothetical protein